MNRYEVCPVYESTINPDEKYCINDRFTGKVISGGYKEDEKKLVSQRCSELNSQWKKAKAISKAFADAVNGDMKEMIAEAILTEHRTLQQQIFELFLVTMKKWADLPEDRYDLRNEFTVQTSRKIMEMTKDTTRVPLI